MTWLAVLSLGLLLAGIALGLGWLLADRISIHRLPPGEAVDQWLAALKEKGDPR